MIQTYQTRIATNDQADAALSAYAALFGKVLHHLHADTQRGLEAGKLKSPYLARFDLTARQFNAVKNTLKGIHESYVSNRDRYIDEKADKIERLDKTIEKLIKRAGTESGCLQEKTLFTVKQKQLKRDRIFQERQALLLEMDQGKTPVCFGSRKLFRAQFNLAENGYAEGKAGLDEWRQDWHFARTGQFFVQGSKDETAGCQGCVATLNPEGTFDLRLRLPDALKAEHGTYVTFNNVAFAYGSENIQAALGYAREYKTRKKVYDQALESHITSTGMPKKEAAKHPVIRQIKRVELDTLSGALSYRFIKDKKGWRVFVSTDVQPVPVITDKRLGALGIDLNADHLALIETDRSGNPIRNLRIPLDLRDKTSYQRDAIIGDAAKQVMTLAAETRKPVVIEKLDFKEKKREMIDSGERYNRMLSALPYQQIQAMLRAAAHRQGIEIGEVNPAYTSVIGREKFMQRYGLSVHHAAALVIARRFLGYSEKPHRQGTHKVLDGKCSHIWLALPARNRCEKDWKYWGKYRRTLRPALAAHFREKYPGGRYSPPAAASPPDVDSDIPW